MIQCAACGCDITVRRKNQRYCRTCGYEAKKARQRKYDADRPYEFVRVAPVVRTPQPQRTVLRARTLADTPEIPSVMAARDSMLTGGAPAAGYAHAVRMVGVGI